MGLSPTLTVVEQKYSLSQNKNPTSTKFTSQLKNKTQAMPSFVHSHLNLDLHKCSIGSEQAELPGAQKTPIPDLRNSPGKQSVSTSWSTEVRYLIPCTSVDPEAQIFAQDTKPRQAGFVSE